MATCPGGLAVIALSLAVLMAFASALQQCTGNSGWVDTIWTLAVGLIGAGSAEPRHAALAPEWVRNARTSMFFPLRPGEGPAA
ncbi:hypothetical protein [Bradyrhizobium neotropicale]|uniref:hypothetical protein n=1 Tax=Bradyrhizobium neotropicale TaxID=1497615 RepID=UPI000B20EC83|nr:hypothetical protein [Bradyrhizobium neotropicale]